jgi:hypothetical protein
MIGSDLLSTRIRRVDDIAQKDSIESGKGEIAILYPPPRFAGALRL